VVQAPQASLLPAENCPAPHSTQVLSAEVVPVVQKDPSAQAAASAVVQAPQASLLPAENCPAPHSTQLLSAEAVPVVQKDPSAQAAALTFDQSWQAAPPVEYWVPVQASQSSPSPLTVEPSSQTAQVLSAEAVPVVHL
jgi:hypothetical protein